jgi:hypothetical protein
VINTSNALKQSSHSPLISHTIHISFHPKEGRTVAPQRCGAHLLSLPDRPPAGAWRPGVPREPTQSHRLDPKGLSQSSRRLRFCSSPAAKAWLQRLAWDPTAHPENPKIRLQGTAHDKYPSVYVEARLCKNWPIATSPTPLNDHPSCHISPSYTQTVVHSRDTSGQAFSKKGLSSTVTDVVALEPEGLQTSVALKACSQSLAARRRGGTLASTERNRAKSTAWLRGSWQTNNQWTTESPGGVTDNS